MAYKKKKFKPYHFEKIGSSNLSATLYASMLQHPSYYRLNGNAVRLYQYMKLQFYGQKDKPNNQNDCFTFNKAMYTKVYPIYKNGEQFSRDSHALIKYGFIEMVENGKTTRTKNIYRFSSKWQEWVEGADFRPIAMQKHDNAKGWRF